MKKTILGTLNFLVIIICITGCKKNDLLRYRSGGDIYFVMADTIRYSFAKDTLTTAEIGLDVSITGPLAPVNRSFSLMTDSVATSAVADKHYVRINAGKNFIPARMANQRISLTLLRPADLYEKSVRLVLKLMPDNNFKTSILTNMDDSAFLGSVVVKTIIIDDILRKPDVWDANNKALGTYSRGKLELMVKVCGLTLKGFYADRSYSRVQLMNAAVQMQDYLNRQKRTNKPVLEAGGTEMRMGSAAQ